MDFNEKLKNVTVRIKSKGDEQGTGIILKSKEYQDKLYIFTAKHCILGRNYKNGAKKKDVKIEKINLEEGKTSYRVKTDDQIIFDDVLDLAAIVVNIAGFPAFEKLPNIEIAWLATDESSFALKGFPRMRDGKKQHTAEGTLNTKDTGKAKFRLTIPSTFFDYFEKSEIPACVPGFSGSGVCSNINGNVFLQGIVTKWRKSTGFEGISVVDFIQKHLPKITIYHTQVETSLSDDVLKAKLYTASEQLKPRYSEINMPVAIEDVFDQLVINQKYKDYLRKNLEFRFNDLNALSLDQTGVVREFITANGFKFYHTSTKKTIYRTGIRSLNNNISQVSGLIHFLVMKPENPENWIKLNDSIIALQNTLGEVSNSLKTPVNPIRADSFKRFSPVVNSALRATSILLDILARQKIVGRQWMMVDGEAGSGKSQLLAIAANNRMNQGLPSILVLGQSLQETDVLDQIAQQFSYQGKSDEFLELLNRKASNIGHPAIVFIDAINEGRGLRIWNTQFSNVIEKIKPYSNIRLVVSYRSSYKRVLFRGISIDENAVVTHYGFKNQERAAVKFFFENANLPIPNIPKFSTEFSNPLFLILFVKLYKENPRLNVNTWYGITYVFQHFFHYVNEQLGHANRYNYDYDRLNLVQLSIKKFVKEILKQDRVYLKYSKAFKIIEKTVSTFVTKKGFLNDLIHEGIFYDNAYPRSIDDYVIGVDFAYQKLGEHIKASYILGKIGKKNLFTSFEQNGKLHRYFTSQETIQDNIGMVEALFIQIPVAYGVELFDIRPQLMEYTSAVIAFINTLRDRTGKSFSDRTKSLITAISNSGFSRNEIFWDNVLQYVFQPGNGLNVEFVHNYLMSLSMADRDANWSHYLQNTIFDLNSSTPVSSVIAWAFDYKRNVAPNSSELIDIGTMLFWYFTSNDRNIRDNATKAAIFLFQDNIDSLIVLMKRFENVNDPYVSERAYAVALGATLRTSNPPALEEISKYVYDTIFDKPEVFPHILLRDYARLLIEFTVTQGVVIRDISKIRPPYNSKDFAVELENLEIQNYAEMLGYQDGEGFAGVHKIIDSMITEHGRKGHMYGDFGRYVFGYAFKYWPELDDEMMSDLALKMIVEEFGYNRILSDLDATSGNYGRGRDSATERIGKKYQWLAFHKLLAIASDHYKFKEYPHSAETTSNYRGPWIPNVRDIDPTSMQVNWGITERERWWVKDPYVISDQPAEKWIRDNNDIPLPENFIVVKDITGEEWLVLQTYYSQKETNNAAPKEIWYQLRSYITKKNEHKKIVNWAKKQNFMGRWMPESSTRTEMYLQEYFWAPAVLDFKHHYYGGGPWEILNDRKTGKRIGEVSVSALEYLWEEQLDKSQETTTSLLLPNEVLFKALDLKPSLIDGTFLSQEGRILAFDPSDNKSKLSFLVVNKQALEVALEQNSLDIFWTLLGEKFVSNSDRAIRTSYGKAEISIVATLENGSISTSKRVILNK
jgi:hypothetical protein